MFAAHDIERAYLAVTRGAPRPLVGRIETNIARSPSDRKKMAVMKEKHFRADHWSNDPNAEGDDTPHGKIAITNYRALETFGRLDTTGTQPAAALVECRLETGRTHQIRVHLAHIGAPVLGDQTYGKHRWLKAAGKGPAFERATAAAKAFPRQALHAAILGFEHPVTHKALRFERNPPADMAELIAALRAMP
jgi:23S rRNA pseudouridine1911/1915/1917 synthase